MTDKLVSKSDLHEFYNRILPYLGGSAEAGFTPVGTVISVMGKTAPANYLPCDGRVVNISDYPELADYFKEQFGSSNYFGGDGTTTFGIVDLSGEFLRGAGTNNHTDQGDGAEVGEHQNATTMPPLFASSTTLGVARSGDTEYAIENYDKASGVLTNTRPSATVTKQTMQTSGLNKVSVRPTNTSVLFCIATKNIYLNPSLDFSTSEKVVGTWIDQKPLYQRTITGTIPANTFADASVTYSLNTSSLNIDECVYLSGYMPTSNYEMDLPAIFTTSGAIKFIRLTYNNTDGNVYMNANTSAPNGLSYYITLRYTKTTD